LTYPSMEKGSVSSKSIGMHACILEHSRRFNRESS
jgi:hypothetical protein